METHDPLPQEAYTAAEFVDCLRRLKEQTGLTYRQLEFNAEQSGDVLARSTAADMLRRDSLPRPEVVLAFVRACGRGESAAVWLGARNRLATAAAASAPLGAEPSGRLPLPPDGRRGGRGGGRRTLAVAVGAVLMLAAVGAWALLPEGGSEPDSPARGAGPTASLAVPATASPGTGPAPAAGLSRIRPASAPQLCVTDGHDRLGRYRSEVAVQRECAGATPPETSLVPVGRTGSFYIQWRHPVHGDGCLTALGSGHVVEGLLEPWPWESCSADRTSQHFLFEPLGRSGAEGYRIRVVHNGLCLGVADVDAEAGAEAGAEIAQQRCTEAAGQRFLVDAVG
ncbi:XRE family transcriptional regulator [Kitasatospora sp. NPDC097605]|uniref:XRE family transcriptional regulator n=1 Tax=Kitasatospora sp. NPDC097605 TaxID=3157226 RepID=UPI00331CD875